MNKIYTFNACPYNVYVNLKTTKTSLEDNSAVELVNKFKENLIRNREKVKNKVNSIKVNENITDKEVMNEEDMNENNVNNTASNIGKSPGEDIRLPTPGLAGN